MKITCKLGTKNIKVVEVSPNDQLNILLTKLNITDKTAKFIYKGILFLYSNTPPLNFIFL